MLQEGSSDAKQECPAFKPYEGWGSHFVIAQADKAGASQLTYRRSSSSSGNSQNLRICCYRTPAPPGTSMNYRCRWN